MATYPRYSSLDSYRFFAAMTVLVFHLNTFFDLGLSALFPGIEQFGRCVDFFFLLSGFVIASRYYEAIGDISAYVAFLRSRLARIYPLHLLTVFSAIVLALASQLLALKAPYPISTSISELVPTLMLMEAWGLFDHQVFNPAAWSLSAEWFVYLLTPVFFLLAKRLPLVANLVLITCYILVYDHIRTSLGLIHWMGATYYYGMMRAVPTFFGGVLMARLVQRAPAGWCLPWHGQHLLFAATLALFVTGTIGPWIVALFALLIFSAALTDRNGERSFLQGRMMTGLGNGSFALYMVHFQIIILALWALDAWHLSGPGARAGAALGVAIVSVGLSLLSYRWFEMPVQKWMKLPVLAAASGGGAVRAVSSV